MRHSPWFVATALSGNLLKKRLSVPSLAHSCLTVSRERVDSLPPGLSQLVFGDADIGRRLVTDSRVTVVSATGSTRMGKAVAPLVAHRFGRCILELGGNNAMNCRSVGESRNGCTSNRNSRRLALRDNDAQHYVASSSIVKSTIASSTHCVTHIHRSALAIRSPTRFS